MFRDRGYEERRSFSPVKVGDIVDVKIEAVGEKGDGVPDGPDYEPIRWKS